MDFTNLFLWDTFNHHNKPVRRQKVAEMWLVKAKGVTSLGKIRIIFWKITFLRFFSLSLLFQTARKISWNLFFPFSPNSTNTVIIELLLYSSCQIVRLHWNHHFGFVCEGFSFSRWLMSLSHAIWATQIISELQQTNNLVDFQSHCYLLGMMSERMKNFSRICFNK